ncbi:MAG: hypothetical protein ABGY15_04850 [bacterium]
MDHNVILHPSATDLPFDPTFILHPVQATIFLATTLDERKPGCLRSWSAELLLDRGLALLLVATGDGRCRTGARSHLGALDGALELLHFPVTLELSQRMERRTDSRPSGSS